ncbi:CPBP family intramembrane glutamic endopeptidase [Rothia nasimurium]|uniref:CPBP family intramembrane glutamic endopeptidase n=1 Tax=Rothia nasimurium TaxID=85336 RepID=UPI001F226017|nr:CPBP family intramembrane glutamic endopeptidase [Rothia nasimurium]
MSTPNDPYIPWQTPAHHPAQGAAPGAAPASAHVQEQVPHPLASHPNPVPLPPVGWRPGYRQEKQDLGYHRLSHADPKGAWWKPLVEAVIGVPLYLVLSLLLVVAFSFVLLLGLDPALPADPSYLLLAASSEILEQDALRSPATFVFLFGSVALMFPALWGARLILGPKPWGLIHSVAGRMRWGWLATCCGLAALLVVVLPLAFDLAVGARYIPSTSLPTGGLIAMLVAIILVVPVQAYAEELVFRGYLMQTIGRWLKHPAWAIIIPAPLFMLGHLYDLWGQLSVLVMGLAAGYITWRTGGLEAAIALHVVNNLLAMSFGVLGMADPFLQQGSTVGMFISALVSNGLFVLVVIWVARKKGIERTRTAQVWVKGGHPEGAQPVR